MAATRSLSSSRFVLMDEKGVILFGRVHDGVSRFLAVLEILRIELVTADDCEKLVA